MFVTVVLREVMHARYLSQPCSHALTSAGSAFKFDCSQTDVLRSVVRVVDWVGT